MYLFAVVLPFEISCDFMPNSNAPNRIETEGGWTVNQIKTEVLRFTEIPGNCFQTSEKPKTANLINVIYNNVSLPYEKYFPQALQII